MPAKKVTGEMPEDPKSNIVVNPLKIHPFTKNSILEKHTYFQMKLFCSFLFFTLIHQS